MTFKIQMDSVRFSRKPKGDEIGDIKKRMAARVPENLGLRRFAELVTEGCSYGLGILSGGAGAENWTEQQVFGIDIDNEDKKKFKEHIKDRAEKPLTVQDILDRCAEYGVFPALIYETFSSSPNWQKFRVIFVMDRVTADGEERDRVQRAFVSMFPECDSVCVNRDRIFFGGKKICFMDENAVNNYGTLLNLYKNTVKEPEKVPPKKQTFSNDEELNELKQAFDFLGYIRSFGCTEKNHGRYIVFSPCPICSHNDDFVFYPESNSFMCFGASGNCGGSVIDFVMHTRKVGRSEAVKIFKHELCGIPEKERFSVSVKGGKTPENRAETPLRSLDDTGNSQRLYDLCGDVAKYSYTDKNWLYYADGRWHDDNRGVVLGYADEVLEVMKSELKQWTELDGGTYVQDFRKHCKKTRSNSSKTAMVREFQHLVPATAGDFDTDGTLVNAKNGVIDLKTGELLPHSPDFLMTKMLGTSLPESPKKPEKWLDFLNQIFNGDEQLIRFIQKALGYSLSGSTKEQCAFFLVGNGRNGKSTFLEVIRQIMGDYAVNAQPESIMVKQFTGGATSDIARLKGARFVTSVEPNEGARIDEGKFKQMTGEDKITARKLFGNEFEFYAECKLWIATNHKPVIRGTDLGIWRRIRVIPFTVTIPEDKIDGDLGDKLALELPDILAWILEGYRLWKREKLGIPKAVADAVKEYQTEMDVIANFLDSEYIQQGGECKSGVLYALYCKWCDENNEYKMSNTKFGREIGKRYTKKHTNKGEFYQGISTYSITIG